MEEKRKSPRRVPSDHGAGVSGDSRAKPLDGLGVALRSLGEESQGARVVLIDDELQVLEALTLCFGPPHEIIHAATGANGLAILQRQPVDVVVLEYRLPDLGGLELLAQIKATQPRLPVIVTTAYGSEWVCASALKLGARDYFIKPFDPADLVASIRYILSTQPRQGEGRENVLATNKDIGKLLSYQRPSQLITIGCRTHWNELAVHKAARFIQEHYWENISLSQVARQVGMSKFVLSRKFKAVMEASFRKYLLHFRVMKARDLLQMGQYSVSEVAQMVGFGDLPRFDKVFKYSFGVSPSAYRRSIPVSVPGPGPQ